MPVTSTATAALLHGGLPFGQERHAFGRHRGRGHKCSSPSSVDPWHSSGVSARGTDWGLADEPASVAVGTTGAAVVDSDSAHDLPTVASLVARGYTVAPEAPLWCFLPAIWPPRDRLWVPDQRIRTSRWHSADGRVGSTGWTAADYAELEERTNTLLSSLGLAPRPAGRVWLLRSPNPARTVDELLDGWWHTWLAGGGPGYATTEFVEYIASALRASAPHTG